VERNARRAHRLHEACGRNAPPSQRAASHRSAPRR
jgi:hypothetical protein